jgi:hypothetical protein
MLPATIRYKLHFGLCLPDAFESSLTKHLRHGLGYTGGAVLGRSEATKQSDSTTIAWDKTTARSKSQSGPQATEAPIAMTDSAAQTHTRDSPLPRDSCLWPALKLRRDVAANTTKFELANFDRPLIELLDEIDPKVVSAAGCAR